MSRYFPGSSLFHHFGCWKDAGDKVWVTSSERRWVTGATSLHIMIQVFKVLESSLLLWDVMPQSNGA